ncbi:hypothetical protein TruAng_001400 [Truncatella angustata]|nr:hypothetical protein TruAng_001400 [Truncatella angustata]
MGIPYVFTQINPPSIAGVLPNAQLPLEEALTAAATCGSLCTNGYWSCEIRVPVILVSYLLLGIAILLAFILDALFLGRLYNQTKDKRAKESKSQALNFAYQIMVLAGPWGKGSARLTCLGKAVLDGTFSPYNSGTMLTSEVTFAVGYSSIFASIFFWGTAIFWWVFTVISILRYEKF